MNYYQFHVGDYAVHTRHLSLLEDLAYRRLLDWYYTNEKPLPLDPSKTARLIGMPDNIKEVSDILSDFFLKSEDGYRNKRCDEEIEKYQAKADRAKHANSKRWESNSDLKSDMESERNQLPTNNQEPATSNQVLNICTEPPAPAPSVTLPLNDKTEFPIFENQIAEWQELYPAADVRQELRNMRGWLIGNPQKRKTKSGILRFVTSWLAKEQNRGGSHEKNKRTGEHLTPVQKVQRAFAERRAGGEALDSRGADLRGQVDS